MDRMEDTRRSYNELNNRLEAAMMTGNVLLLNNEREIKHALGYIASAIGSDKSGEEIFQMALQYSDTNKTEIAGFSTSKVYGDPCINVILRDKDSDFRLDDEEGILCYVFNAKHEDYSEIGYCFFEERTSGNVYHRIG